MSITGKKSSKLRRWLLAASLLIGFVPAFAQSGTIIKPKKIHDVVYATAYADSGTGAAGSCWALTGSNPIQAALTACPAAGCDVMLGDGCYTLGAADPAISITKTTARTDKRVYRIIGAGKDKSILNYSGTGTAIRYWQDHTGTPGSSFQSNANMLRGFALRQTGTDRTGVGIWLNYASRWTLDDLTIGTMIADRATTQTGFEYGIKFAERSGSYQTVDDFNTISNSYFSGNTHAIFTGQQSDNIRIEKNYFDGNPNVSAAQDGVELTAFNGGEIVGNTFNFFKFSASMFAIKLSDDVSGVTIAGNYFEGNWFGIVLNDQHDIDGISITGNMISTNSVIGTVGSPAFCIDAGLSSATWVVRGLHISGNTFDSIGEYEYGIRLRSDVKNAVVGPNQYHLVGGSNDFNNVTLPGATVTWIGEGRHEQSTTSDIPQLDVVHASADSIAIKTENVASNAGCSANLVPFTCCTGSGAGTCDSSSPWIQWIAGGSHLAFSSYVDAAGAFHLRNASDQMTVSAAGVVAPGASFLGALTGNVTGDLTGSVTAGSGKSVVATAGTVRIPNSTSLPGTCTIGDEYMDTDATVGQQFFLCTATNTWTLMGDGGGSVAFSAISGGTNTLATMLVGSGASLNATGTGVIGATTVPGTGVSGNITGTATNVSGTVATDHGGTGLTTWAQGDIPYASAIGVISKLTKDTNVTRALLNTGTSNNPAWGQVPLFSGVSGTLPVGNGGTGLTTYTSGGVPYASAAGTLASSAALASLGIVVGGGAGGAPATSATTASIAGSIAIPAAQTLDIAAHATDGGSLILKEGADDGTNTVTIKVPDAGITASKTITFVTATGNLPASAIESSGTNDKCANFNASGILVPASGSCSTGGGGSGTVTGVGPGCTTGLCYTDTTLTAGTVMWVWEGSTSDANQFQMNVPANPTTAINWTVPDATTALTFPSGTDTLIGKATTDILTEKTLNVESSGNVLTTVEKLWLPAAGCNNATAASFWDLPTANAPTPTCVTSATVQKGTLAFPDSDGAYSAQQTLLLPSDWTGTIDAKINWFSAITTGDVFWQVSTLCVADGELDDGVSPAFATASTVPDTAKGTTLQTNNAAITTVTVTGCAAGELMHLKIMRDRTNASDTLGASSAQLIGVELTLRRAQ